MNGEIKRKQHADYLKSSGYRIEKCNGVPERTFTDEERAEMDAADRMLGRHRGLDGKTAIGRLIERGMSELTAPLRKSTYKESF